MIGSTRFYVWFFFWGICAGLPALGAQTRGAKPPRALNQHIYIYASFNVLFELPFKPSEAVRIEPVSPSPSIFRRDFIEYRTYVDEGGLRKRSLMLRFYAVESGILELPSYLFTDLSTGRHWESEPLLLPIFAYDEVEQKLPLEVNWSTLPAELYLGQSILLSVWAKHLEVFENSRLLEPLQLNEALIERSPAEPQIVQENLLGIDTYSVPLASWIVTPTDLGVLRLPPLRAQVQGLTRTLTEQNISILPLPENPYRREDASFQPAIGEFEFSLNWSDPPTQNRYALDDTIEITRRIFGTGNFTLLEFPPVDGGGLTLLEVQKTEDYEPVAEGYRGSLSQTYRYKAPSHGTFMLRVPDFPWFDPGEKLWKAETGRSVSLEFVARPTRDKFKDWEQFWFSKWNIYSLNVMYWIQKNIGYFLLLPILTVCYWGASYRFRAKIRLTELWRFLRVKHRLPVFGSGMLLLVSFCIAFFGRPDYLLLQRAETAFQNGEYSKAELIYRNFLQEETFWPGVLPNMALLQYRQGNTVGALESAYRSYYLQPLVQIPSKVLKMLRKSERFEERIPYDFIWQRIFKVSWPLSQVFFCYLFLFVLLWKYWRRLRKNRDETAASFSQPLIYRLDPEQNELAVINPFRPWFFFYLSFLGFSILSIMIYFLPSPSVGVNIKENFLQALPHQTAEPGERPPAGNYQLRSGELVMLKGRAPDSDLYLVRGEDWQLGWLSASSFRIIH